MLTLLGGLALATAATATADENWRRTAQGWERIETWRAPQQTFGVSAVTSANAPRWDTHPAALAFIELAAVIAAMIAFPRPNQSAQWRWLKADWRAALAKSFRASVFGS